MFTVLLESRAARPRRLNSTVLSTAAHVAAIAALVALSLDRGARVQPVPSVSVDTLRFVVPAASASSPVPTTSRPDAGSRDPIPDPDLPRIPAPTVTPGEIPPVDVSVPGMHSGELVIGAGRPGALTGGLPGLGSDAGEPGGITDVRAVDRAPALVGRAAEPRYPATLRAAGIQGRVLAEFVVDTLGRAELASLRFPELADPLFGDAVRDAIARYRFTPGEVSGRKVRTRVAVPFEFRLER